MAAYSTGFQKIELFHDKFVNIGNHWLAELWPLTRFINKILHINKSFIIDNKHFLAPYK